MNSAEGSRLLLRIHYDGSDFFGWQRQSSGRTVQGELESSAERLTGAPRRFLGAGRTDRGVHATGQAAAVTVPSRWTPGEFRRAMNAVLPSDIWIESARSVPPRFNPRHEAVARTYRYRVGTAEGARSPFNRRWCWPLDLPLDRALLDRSAATIPGYRSFRAFAKSGQEERGDRCRVDRVGWEEIPGLGIELTITANRFLHHMVRYLVGTMVEIARGRRDPADLEALLEGSDDRLETSPPAPPEGLFLAHVAYPDEERPDGTDAPLPLPISPDTPDTPDP